MYIVSVCSKTIGENIADPTNMRPPVRIQSGVSDRSPTMCFDAKLKGEVMVLSNAKAMEMNCFGSKVVLVCDDVEVIR